MSCLLGTCLVGVCVPTFTFCLVLHFCHFSFCIHLIEDSEESGDEAPDLSENSESENSESHMVEMDNRSARNRSVEYIYINPMKQKKMTKLEKLNLRSVTQGGDKTRPAQMPHFFTSHCLHFLVLKPITSQVCATGF